jgi:hypothetical protein
MPLIIPQTRNLKSSFMERFARFMYNVERGRDNLTWGLESVP